MRIIQDIHGMLTRLENGIRNNNTLQEKTKNLILDLQEEQKFLKTIENSALEGSALFAKIYADFDYLKNSKIADFLNVKKRPAYKASEQVKLLSRENRDLIERLKIFEYKTIHYESLFPKLEDIVDDTHEDYNTYEDDEVLKFLSKDEYLKLSTTERNQRALDRYINQNHSKKHIGKMYERYIGYLYETHGCEVEYYGIKKKLEDLGRDLIVKYNNQAYIVQCKYWSKHKLINENVICQLFGTTMKFKLDCKKKLLPYSNITPILVTNIKLSETANEFAEQLGVKIVNIHLDTKYPMIKCNINNNNKIYHLPFDQMYDITEVKKANECYVATVKEAESLGFRRAKRHIFNKQ